MRLCSIASGSSGNCIYVGSDNTHILVDAGISGKRVEEGLNRIGLTTRELNGILITHEHSDHIGGIGVIARKYGIPLYATQGTFEGLMESKTIGKIDTSLFNVIRGDNSFIIDELNIRPVNVSHDAKEPVAYRIDHRNKSVGVCTDLGKYDEKIIKHFEGVEALLIEANHDVNMLQVGSYPYPLKQRILGDKGHLSNEACGRLLARLLNDNLGTITLGHLSAENNMAELAYEAVRLELLMDEQCRYNPNDLDIKVANRNEVSEMLAI